jgi:hypothetical protein
VENAAQFLAASKAAKKEDFVEATVAVSYAKRPNAPTVEFTAAFATTTPQLSRTLTTAFEKVAISRMTSNKCLCM